MSLHVPLSGGVNSDEYPQQTSSSSGDTRGEHVSVQMETSGGATPSTALCPWCPCAHIERQLGLQAADQTDALRVWMRFGSIALMVRDTGTQRENEEWPCDGNGEANRGASPQFCSLCACVAV